MVQTFSIGCSSKDYFYWTKVSNTHYFSNPGGEGVLDAFVAPGTPAPPIVIDKFPVCLIIHIFSTKSRKPWLRVGSR